MKLYFKALFRHYPNIQVLIFILYIQSTFKEIFIDKNIRIIFYFYSLYIIIIAVIDAYIHYIIP